MIWICGVEVLGMMNVVWGASPERAVANTEIGIEKKMNDEKIRRRIKKVLYNSPDIFNYRKMILYPFVIHNDSFLVFPTTKYNEIESGKREYVKKIMREITKVALKCMGVLNTSIYYEWIKSLIEAFATAKIQSGYFDSVYLSYEKNGTFRDLTKRIVKECKKTLDELGEILTSKASEEIKKIEALPDPDSEENKKRKEKLKEIEIHGKVIRTIQEQDQIVKGMNMVCDECLNLWKREEDIKSFILKLGLRRLHAKELRIKPKNSYYQYKSDILSLIGYLDHNLLINTNKEHGREVAAELVKEAFLEYKDDYENEINRIVLEVEERKKRNTDEKEMKEKEANQNAEELMREEEEEKRRSKGKGKGKVVENSRKRKIVTKDKKEEIEDKKSEKGAVGGKKEEKTKKKNYEIHGRVFQWKKEPEVIKNILDEGTEQKWRGRSIEEIKEQKKFHDIVEAVGLLRHEDADDFFDLTRSYEERGVKRERKVALAMLETKESGKEIGIVEVGIFRDGGNDVVYHGFGGQGSML
ncbi:uncharacterized protein Eint_050030 [Encephalitozoon intestinalis ATCC 50506]|uniref:InterB family protein n=1 Tax=Encephalitozoon intestinalis (strain ATCC 50506) TaxID=876142 RepID=E0S724_ENCIT|nr:uncharacterized protein Eint_050030 [Encephalitozoon intestinalis ATCC 50506]ADM11452.1 hypothetical protein Eint_050030 [Encephalitozoon intestinalis ATCC 50506]